MSFYIVYDGRARFDEDRASVLDCIGEGSRKWALNQFNREWGDCDAVLFEYDAEGNNLVNGRMVDPEG